jgi:hypothetical protein
VRFCQVSSRDVLPLVLPLTSLSLLFTPYRDSDSLICDVVYYLFYCIVFLVSSGFTL